MEKILCGILPDHKKAENLYEYAKIKPSVVRAYLKEHPEDEAAFYDLLAAYNEADLYEYFTGQRLAQPTAMLYTSIDEEGNIEKGGSATNADGYTDSFWAKFDPQGNLVDSGENHSEGPTTQWPEAYIPAKVNYNYNNNGSGKKKSNAVIYGLIAAGLLLTVAIAGDDKKEK